MLKMYMNMSKYNIMGKFFTEAVWEQSTEHIFWCRHQQNRN